jgi:hypothetical protein
MLPFWSDHICDTPPHIHQHTQKQDGSLRAGLQPEAFGLMAQVEHADIDAAGIEALIARHTNKVHKSKEAFYGTHCVEVGWWWAPLCACACMCVCVGGEWGGLRPGGHARSGALSFF